MKLILSTSDFSAFNLAAEEFLFSQSDGEFALLYVNSPSVILGNNQIAVNEANIEFCLENNIPIIRRISGGGAVYHDSGNLNFAFIGNKNAEKQPLNYDFLKPVIEILQTLNIPVETGKRKDLWLGEKKISGTAAHFSRSRYLFHGTLLYNSNLYILEKALTVNKKDETQRGTLSFRSKVGNINEICSMDFDDFIKIFLKKLSEYFNNAEILDFNNNEIIEIQQLATEKYLSEEWNFKK